MSTKYPQLADPEGSHRRTRLTERLSWIQTSGDAFRWRLDRPALIVSSCSWSPDDDFSVLLEALDLYDSQAASGEGVLNLPRIICIVSGRGPLKDFYSSVVARRTWRKVEVLMPWLEWIDYPRLLGCADLGVSLHRSSSGVDLPMKVG
ncbi:unnamed protein product [Protopolystoma xenopodis]|uniref:Chitobiosyldiphosphodolichol beta-mannosyltransferase n=1 Tax=Protopolystoma xenopodis TaxID=117903 RepID=A0A3S4ZNL6_9PLAT|nr:unnamed protein product [Protopolystoma xenopodis]